MNNLLSKFSSNGSKVDVAAQRLAWLTIAVCLVALALAFWTTIAALILLCSVAG